MALIADVLSWLLLLSGGFFVVVGSLGLVRMPEFFTRVHAASVTDTLGAGLIIAGLLLQSPDWLGAIKLILIAMFLILTGPAASHALAKAALHGGLRPHSAPADEGDAALGDGLHKEDQPSNS
jgi:multicomponent Na+:H+ antiporter subunit G